MLQDQVYNSRHATMTKPTTTQRKGEIFLVTFLLGIGPESITCNANTIIAPAPKVNFLKEELFAIYKLIK